MPQIKTIDLPLEGGLDQKTDQYWLEPGSAKAATNLIHKKHGSVEKRAGLQALTNAWVTPAGGKSGPTQTSGTLSVGRALVTRRGALVEIAVAAATLATDVAFVYQDSFGAKQWVAQDQTPEAYLYPYEVCALAVGTNNQYDIAIANGLELLVWSQTTIGASAQAVYAMARDAFLGTVIMPPTKVSATETTSAPGSIKAIVCGNLFVVAWSDAGGSNNIYAATANSTTPAAGGEWFGTPTRINLVNGGVTTTSTGFDIATAIGDTGNFALIYRSSTPTIDLVIVTASTLTASRSVTTVGASDTTWTTTDTKPAITSFCIRADNGLNEVAFSYAWKTATTNRVAAGLWTYSALAQKRATINLLAGGSIGPISVTADNVASPVSLELVKSTPHSTYQTRWSPSGSVLGPSATQLPYIAYWQWTDNGATLAAATNPGVTVGVTLWSRDLVLNGIAYCVGFCPSVTQNTFYLFADDSWTDSGASRSVSTDFFPMRLVGTIAPRLSSAMTSSSGVTIGSPVHIVANPYAQGNALYETTFPVDLTLKSVSPAIVRWDMQSPRSYQSCELGENTMLACGAPSGFDGQTCFELGFPYYPVIVSLTAAGSGGNLSAGTYLYIAVFAWTDAKKQAHLSARSVVASVNTVLNDQVTAVISTMGFSARTKSQSASGNGSQQANWPVRQPVQVTLYRTQVGGTSYNLLGPAITLGTTNKQGATTISIVDVASDASILSNPLLYGDGSDGTQPGNNLDNNCPPAFQGIIVHQQRLYGFDGPRVWPSKEFTTGEGSAFHEEMAFSVDDGPGPITALASMDEKLVIFKSDRIYFVTGLGPADNGQDNDYTQPARIASDVGCIDWRGVVTTPEGIYFFATSGRRLLTRDLQVIPVPIVEDIDQANSAVTSAVIHPTFGRVKFTQNTDDVTTPRVGTIVYHDYVIGSWTQTVVNDNAGHATLGFVSAAVAQGVTIAGPPVVLTPTYHVLRADGTVMREFESPLAPSNFDTATAGGANIYVPSTWTSPWLKADGLQGWGYWHEVRVAFQALDAAAITVSIAYDGNPTPTDSFTFTAAQIASMGAFPIIALQPTNNRAATMQITITDASSGAPVTGAGFRLQGVRVDYGYEPGGFRAPIGQQA